VRAISSVGTVSEEISEVDHDGIILVGGHGFDHHTVAAVEPGRKGNRRHTVKHCGLVTTGRHRAEADL